MLIVFILNILCYYSLRHWKYGVQLDDDIDICFHKDLKEFSRLERYIKNYRLEEAPEE